MNILSSVCLFSIFILLAGCTPTEVKMADDFLEGEVKVVETIVNDASGLPQKQ